MQMHGPLVYKNTKTFSRIDISLSSNETVCTECGNEITDPSKRRKLFNLSTKTSACKNLLNLDSCLYSNVCRNCVDKNSNLLDLLQKVDSVCERFNVIEVNLIEKNQTTVTEKQRGGDCDQREDVARVQNPVKTRVVFSTNDLVLIISNRDQETQTKPETSEEILESLDASSVTVLINKVYFDTLYF
jgi:hypothetical protein